MMASFSAVAGGHGAVELSMEVQRHGFAGATSSVLTLTMFCGWGRQYSVVVECRGSGTSEG